MTTTDNQPPDTPQQSSAPTPLATPTTKPPHGGRPMTALAWAWLVALVGWTVLLSCYHLDGGAGLEPVEAWVTQPAREMYQNISTMLANREEQGWQWEPIVVPEFCGETRMQKSPGAYWTVCLTSYLRGGVVDEVSARIPNAVAAILIVLTVFWLTRRIAGDRAAVFAGFAASSSAAVVYWSHNAASDMGVAALITMSLACLWLASEDQPPGWKRNLLWLLGYLFAGLAMLYKMPLPLACIGLPAVLYVLLFNRWRIFKSWWHLLGLALFLLPWLPWALAAMHFEPMAIAKWRVEYFDRLTGDLPNVQSQHQWYWHVFYVGVALLLTAPYSLSVPQAVIRGFRRQEGVNRCGTVFALIWFLSLLVFYSVAVGKETRYFLPALPPLFVLLGCELAAFFSPERKSRPGLDRLGFAAVAILVPGALAAMTLLLRRFWDKDLSKGIATWPELWQPYAVAAALFSLGTIIAAWLYYRRKESASFGVLCGTMWLVWLWVWPQVMPIVSSQAPFKDFAAQLQRLAPEERQALAQISHQDPRYVWYGDVRFPRTIDQLELLKEEGGRRDLAYETRRVGEEILTRLEGDQLALFVASPKDYIAVMARGEAALTAEGREMPVTHLWLTATVGREDRRYVVFGNRPPTNWAAPELPELTRQALEKTRAKAMQKMRESALPPAPASEPAPPASQPASAEQQPASQPANEP